MDDRGIEERGTERVPRPMDIAITFDYVRDIKRRSGTGIAVTDFKNPDDHKPTWFL
jgi:hypothetical protein